MISCNLTGFPFVLTEIQLVVPVKFTSLAGSILALAEPSVPSRLAWDSLTTLRVVRSRGLVVLRTTRGIPSRAHARAGRMSPSSGLRPSSVDILPFLSIVLRGSFGSPQSSSPDPTTLLHPFGVQSSLRIPRIILR